MTTQSAVWFVTTTPNLLPVTPYQNNVLLNRKVPDSGDLGQIESPVRTKVWVNHTWSVNQLAQQLSHLNQYISAHYFVLERRSNVKPLADPRTLAPDPLIPSSGVLILHKPSVWAGGDGPEEDEADSTNTAGL